MGAMKHALALLLTTLLLTLSAAGDALTAGVNRVGSKPLISGDFSQMPTLHWLTKEDDVKAAQKVPYRLLEECRNWVRATLAQATS